MKKQNGQTPVYGRVGHGVENENLSRQALHITWGRESGEGFPRQRVEGECRYHKPGLNPQRVPRGAKKSPACMQWWKLSGVRRRKQGETDRPNSFVEHLRNLLFYSEMGNQ